MSNAVAPGFTGYVTRHKGEAFAAFERLPYAVRVRMTKMALPVDSVQVLEFYLAFGLTKTMMVLENTERVLLEDWRRLIAEAVAK